MKGFRKTCNRGKIFKWRTLIPLCYLATIFVLNIGCKSATGGSCSSCKTGGTHRSYFNSTNSLVATDNVSMKGCASGHCPLNATGSMSPYNASYLPNGSSSSNSPGESFSNGSCPNGSCPNQSFLNGGSIPNKGSCANGKCPIQ